MGDDGTRGAAEFKKHDHPVLAQDPDTCVVDGMPSSAISKDVVSDVLSIKQIGHRLKTWGTRQQSVLETKQHIKGIQNG